MARKHTPTLRHRGYLYAQGLIDSTPLFDGRVTAPNNSVKRMKFAEAWRAGYLAAMKDARRRDS